MTPQNARLLVIDDDPGLAEVLEVLFSREGYAAEQAGTVQQALARAREAAFDLVVTDLRLPDGTGLDVIRALREQSPELPVIMITSYSSMESAIEALRAGAVDYIVKPFDNEELLHAVERAVKERRVARENAILKRNLRSSYRSWPIIGDSPGLRRVVELVRKAAPSDAAVLISGESGTGKKLVAATLHYTSRRADGPFVVANCGALPREALEQQLFGHQRGSGAAPAEGLIHDARGGSLFLDDVSELPRALQVKLLEAVEDDSLDVRFLAATGRDLVAATEQGSFRRDLYYRLSVISIELPPLRERGPDRLLLARHFAAHHARRLGKEVPSFDPEFEAFVENHPWPGNVRELENMIERAVILAEGPRLTGRDLAEVAPALPMVRAAAPLSGGARPLAIEEYIREVIERFQDTHSETELARMLGIGRKALWMRRRQWGLKRTRRDVSR